MKSRPIIFSLAGCLLCLLAGVLWLRAEDSPSPGPDAENQDKWSQIQTNHKEMLKKVDQIEENLNFIKARSMSGGRRT